MVDSPRLLTRQQAARYCGLSPSGFGKWVRAGRLPRALPGTRRWDRQAVDAALDRIMALQAEQAHLENRASPPRLNGSTVVPEGARNDVEFEEWLHSDRSEADDTGPGGPAEPTSVAAFFTPLSPMALMRAMKLKRKT
ncbi:MAG: helix-turn-helix domain-containing protein [Microvirga sp.]